MMGLSALGLALSTYLGWHYLMGGKIIGCGAGGACEQVLNSRWSTIGGVVPVSGLAAGTYLAMLMASLLIGPKTAPPDRRLAWSAMLVLVGAAAGSAVWFIIVQRSILGTFCPYCMATHITGLLLAVLVIWRAVKQSTYDTFDVAQPAPDLKGATPPRDTPAAPRSRGRVRPPTVGLCMVGLALAAVMAAFQVAFAPPPVSRGGEVSSSQPTIDPRAVPLVGSPTAPYVVTMLFDYKCPHCQKMHAMLDEAVSRYDGKVAFALCPAPLNNRCNPYISRQVPEFADSCELARLALAVWTADHQAFAAFDRWMFSPDPGKVWRARTLDDANAKAIELIGQEKLEAAQIDPWVDQFMHTSTQLFGDTINPDQSGNAVPKLVFGSRWITPQPADAEDLISTLQASLAIPPP